MSQQTFPCTSPPPQNCRLWVHFFSYCRCLVFPKKVLKGKSEYFGVIQVKRLQNVVFQHIYSDHILINLTLFDDIERPII